jgi:hypothetical protein
MERVERDEAGAGEIISIAGIKGGGVNVTLLSADEKTWPDGVPQPLPVRILPPSSATTLTPPPPSPPPLTRRRFLLSSTPTLPRSGAQRARSSPRR